MKKIIGKIDNLRKAFMKDSRSVGILLLICTFISLMITNMPDSGWYGSMWHAQLGLGKSSGLPQNGLKWVNDFLMAFFFLVAGMEIKKELVKGELSSFKKAILPFGAALGGMIVPALIFLAFNINSGFAHGWGIPTATDIAFSLGIASLFGKRLPISLKIFLLALAIIDDLGAIIVIALFYGGHIDWIYFSLAVGAYGLLWFCNLRKLKLGVLQLVLSLVLWYTLLNSGIEGSIAGVLVAFALPVNSLSKIEHSLQKVVNFIILPLFAMANTAIFIPVDIVSSLNNSISMGVMVGLVIGKPLGIYLFSRLLVGLRIASLPSHAQWKHLIGMGTLAGIGFTMSIFTTTLAFNSEAERDIAKIAIIASLILSTVLSAVYFSLINRKVTITTALPKKSLEQEINPDVALG